MKEPPNEGPDDWFFDERSQRWLRHSGCARWRRILDVRNTDEARAVRREADDVFLARLGLRRVDVGVRGAAIVRMHIPRQRYT